ncbi:serine-rich adhesin for platelets-like [Haliotis cracherodii]|uniref:serine-rich adhesin for platelets-like n=1 Tax=Haliotis cracherodii TaxID=6455 RepID=UPI0039E90059
MSATEEEYAKFLCFCEQSLSGPSKQLITLVKKRYDECSDKFKGTQELYQLLASCRQKMESDNRHLFVHLKDCLNELKAYAKGRKGEKRKQPSEYDSDDTVWKRTKTSNGEFRDKEDKNSKSRSLTSSPVLGEPSKQAIDNALQSSTPRDKQRESKLKISPHSACSSKLADIIRNLKDKKSSGEALTDDTVASEADSLGNGCTTNIDGDLKSEDEKKSVLPETGNAESAVLNNDDDDDDDDCILIDDSPPCESTDSLKATAANTDVNFQDDGLKPSGSDSALNVADSKPAKVNKLSLSSSRTLTGFRPLTPDICNADISLATNGTIEAASNVVTGDHSVATNSARSPSADDGGHSNNGQKTSLNSGKNSVAPMISKLDTVVNKTSDVAEKDSELQPDVKSDSVDVEEDEKPKRSTPSVDEAKICEQSPGSKDTEILTVSAPESKDSPLERTASSGTRQPEAMSSHTPSSNSNIPSPAAGEASQTKSTTEGSPGTSEVTAESALAITGESCDSPVVITSKPSESPCGSTSEHSDLPIVVSVEHSDSTTDVQPEHCDSTIGVTSEHSDLPDVITGECSDSPSDVMSEHCDSSVGVTSEHCDSPIVIIAEHSDSPTDVTSEQCDSSSGVISEQCNSPRTNQATGSTSQGSALVRGEVKKKEKPVKKNEEPVKKKEEPEKKKEVSEKHIQRLEKLLEKLQTKIQQVQERELSLDDLAEEDSTYIYQDKLTKKFVAVWNKLCELKDRAPTTGRPTERRFNYQGTRYPEVNKKIEKMINKKKIFPDFHDMKRLVAKVSINQKLHLSQKEIDSVAREAFTDVGNLLQQRRQDDYITTFGCKLTDYSDMNHDPAMYDLELKQKLEENQQQGKTNLENVIRKFSDMQYETGEEAVEVPEGSEEDERLEEEDASDEDVMVVNEEDLASDDEDLIEIKPRSKKSCIELLSDTEDRSPSSSPEPQAPPGPAARPDIVSQCWPQTSELPPHWLAKSPGSIIQPRSPSRQGGPSTSTPPPQVSRTPMGSSLSTRTPPPQVSRTPASSTLSSNHLSGTSHNQVTCRPKHRSPSPIEVDDSNDDSSIFPESKNRMKVHDKSLVPSFLDSPGDHLPLTSTVKKQFQTKPHSGGQKVLWWSSLGSNDSAMKRLNPTNSVNKRAVPNHDSVHSIPFSHRPPSSSVSFSASVSPHKRIPLTTHTSSPVRSMNVNGISANRQRECVPPVTNVPPVKSVHPVKKEAPMSPLKQAMQMSSQCYIDIDEAGEEPDVYEVEPPEEVKEVIVLSDSE